VYPIKDIIIHKAHRSPTQLLLFQIDLDHTCPVILGTSIANLSGGNMQGSCEPPGPGQLWSSYQARPDIPAGDH